MPISSVTRSVEIEAPVEEVFDFISDPHRRMYAYAQAYGRSMTVSDVDTSPDGTIRGWKLTTRFPVLPFKVTMSGDRTVHVPNRHIVERAHTPTKDTDDFTFEPSGTGTRLIYYSQYTAPSPALVKAASFLASTDRSHADQIDSVLAEIKSELENPLGAEPTGEDYDASGDSARTEASQKTRSDSSVVSRGRDAVGNLLKRAAWASVGVPSGLLGWFSTRTVFPLTSGTSYRAVADALRVGLRDDVLDVACGSGAFLARHAADAHKVAGIDLSDVQIDLARRALGSRIAAGTAEIVKGDAGSLPWPDATFTAVSCVSSFETFPDPEKVLAEMFRVLRPGGRVVLNIGQRVPPDTQTHRAWDVMWVWSEDDVRRMVEKAGFADVTIAYARSWGDDPVSRLLVWVWQKLGTEMNELRLVTAANPG